MNKLEEKMRITDDLQKKLNAMSQERDDSINVIQVLKKELKLQEQYFNDKNGTEAEYYTKLVEKSIADEKKITELMTKLNADSLELLKYKSEYAKNVKIADDIGAQQVQILQNELNK